MTSEPPTVSFIVPCYNLAHLLAVCLRSILAQTYRDFEILVLDDCSPDNTGEVVGTFDDPRIRYIRNEQNLGHLRNYNKGIALSGGRYVWLISADDFLHQPYVLERYVTLLDRHPNVGYAFCPGYGVGLDETPTRVLGRYSERLDRDRIVPGHVLLDRLLRSNFVLTPSGLVRRECYERFSLFELDLPWCGDWYLWCLFAVHRDVAYFSEPMVCYREHHDASMTSKLTKARLDACAAEEIRIPWMIRRQAIDHGYSELAAQCLDGIARTYGRVLSSERYQSSKWFMNTDAFEASVREHDVSAAEREQLRAQVFLCMGNEYYWQGKGSLAKRFYTDALRANPWKTSIRLKNLLLSLGKPGDYLRRTILAFR